MYDFKDLPLSLRARAFWAGEEAAWPRVEAIQLVSWLEERNLAVYGAEIWLPGKSGPEIPAPIVYQWNAPEQNDGEEWQEFVSRANSAAASYVQSFDWDERDRHYRGRDPYFCIEVGDRGGPPVSAVDSCVLELEISAQRRPASK